MIASEEKTRILVVDDEAGVRAILRHALETEHYEVLEAGTKDELFERLAEGGVSLVTLDLNLDGQDGLALALEIRERHNLPIMMISGRREAADRVKGLEHGADDYVIKPFHLREVVLRIRSLLHRYGPVNGTRPAASGAQTHYTFDGRVLDAVRRELRTLHGDSIDLTGLEYQLLHLFLRHPGRVFSRDEIMRMLKGHDWSPLDRTIDGHIARLRRKIEPSGVEPTMIKSIRGVGYVFAAEVRAS